MCCCFVICIFCIYLIFGWIEKLFLFIIGYEIDALPFWTWEHIVCSHVITWCLFLQSFHTMQTL